MRNVIAIIVAVVVGVFIVVAMGSGVRVEVENVGATDVTDVVVKVAGNTHSIGDVPAGASESVKVEPKGTTKRVELTWKTDGRDCYGKLEITFEDSGYNGLIHFAIDGITVKEVTDDIDVGFY